MPYKRSYRSSSRRKLKPRSKTYSKSYAKSKYSYTKKKRAMTTNRYKKTRSLVYQKGSMKPSLTYAKGPSGIPKRVVCQHKYYTTGNVASSAAATAITYSIRLRSMFDPDFTSTGHQPRGRDQFVALGYSHYKVLSAKVEITMVPEAFASYPNCMFAVIVGGNAIPFPTVLDLVETGPCSNGMVLGKKYLASQPQNLAPSFSSNRLKVTKYIGDLWGKAKRFNYSTVGPSLATEYFDHNSYTSVLSNPDVNTDVFLDLTSYSGDASINCQGFEFGICVTYYTEWMYTGEPGDS